MSEENKEEKDVLKASEKLGGTDSNRVNKSDEKSKPDSVLKPVDNTATQEGINPLAIKDTDTARLKKVTTPTEVSTDTVRLKVIKEKKKQLAGILTASQTIRLRPPSAEEKKTLKLSSDDIAGSSASGTLKVSLPSNSSESGTIKINNAASETLKVVAPAKGVSTDTVKINKATAAAATKSSSKTLKLSSKGSSSATLKVKAGSGSTLKLKPSSGSAATLKLKASDGPKEQAVPSTAAVPPTAKTSQKEVEALAGTGTEPGVLMLVTNLLMTTAAGVAIYFCATQLNSIVTM